jgi:hypothetical protein
MRDRSKLTRRRGDAPGSLIETLESRRLLSGSPFSGPLQVSPGAPLSGIAGESVSGFIAELTGVQDISQFSYPTERPSPRLWIRWGDGSTPGSAYTSIAPNDAFGALVPMGGHVYRRAGDYVIHGAFVWHGRVLARVEQTVHVAQNSSNGVTLYAVAGQPLSDVVLGTLSGTLENPVAFWGDPVLVSQPTNGGWGESSPVAFQPLSPSPQPPGPMLYQVIGTHTYKHPGEYRVRVGGLSVHPSGIADTWETVVYSTVIVTKAVTPHAAGS